MQKTTSKLIQFSVTSTFIALLLLLSSCGGGKNDSNGASGLSYPDCSLGNNGLAGCWVSDACGTGDGVKEVWDSQGVRYLARISQDQVSPVAQGVIDNYYLLYNNDQCTGTPSTIIDRKKELRTQGFEWIIQYEIPSFETCTDRDSTATTPILIPCVAMDLTSDFRPLGASSGAQSMAFGAYDDAIIDTRLCLSGGMYRGFDPDDAGDFGFGPTGWTTRGTELDYVNCLTRFRP